MRFLVINASPNKAGKTSRFVDAFTEAAQKTGEVQVLHLHDNPPHYSRGELTAQRNPTVYQKAAIDCDGLFIATPTYWFNVPAILKSFIEELDGVDTELYARPRALGVAVYAPQGGELGTASSLILSLNHMNFALVEVGYIFHRGIAEDDWAWEDISLMPERMKRTIGS
jgi:multimeric flavodoxin WrbA